MLALLVLGAGIGFLASAQAWWQASGDQAAVAFIGSDATGGLSQALAAVTLAGALLVLVLRPLGRRVLAVALAATGIGMVITGALLTAPDADTVRGRVRQLSLTDQFAVVATAWPWVYAVAGLLVLISAVLLWRGGARWVAGAARFDRVGAADPAPSPSAADLNTDPARAWQAMDAGHDPTEDPDVRTEVERARMDPERDHRRE